MKDPASKLGQFSWALYDWANSAFFAVISTFVFATYFSQGVAPDPVTGTSLWGYTLTASAVVIAIASPVLGAIADASGRRKPWIFAFTALGVAGCFGLWTAWPDPSAVIHSLILFGIANIAFEIAIVFYNAMLPELVADERLGRLSGRAWGLGYVGGMICLVAVLLLFVQAETPLFGLDKETAEHVRISGPFVAAWVAIFSLPLLLFTPDRGRSTRSYGEAVKDGVATVVRTLREFRKYANVARFLIARMIYTDGLNTLFAFGGIYAAGTFGMGLDEVIIFGIVLNITSGLGAFIFAWLDDRMGSKPTIQIALVGLIGCGLAALLVQDKSGFWIAGSLLGIFVGPAQAASRSLMARLAPAEVRTEMFGLYALTGKVTAFLGPLLLALATDWFQSQRAGMATILAFFVVGMALLQGVREPAR